MGGLGMDQWFAPKMNVYFDTNVYRFIRATHEEGQARKLLQTHGCKLTASSGNLFETFAIKGLSERLAELEVLIGVAHTFEPKPLSWYHALELRRELRRLRPSWMQAAPRIRKIRQFLQAHVELWHQARRLMLPPSSAYAVYSTEAEEGTRKQGDFQKWLRGLPGGVSTVSISTPRGDPIHVDLSDPEIYWRAEGLMVWYNAIAMRDPSCRDYADWLAPYLKPNAFRHPSYAAFWLQEASGGSMPLNRLTGLVAFYQLQGKVTRGNAADQLHAGHWLRAHLFFTADRAFHCALEQAAKLHYPEKIRPILIDRSARSCVDQVDAALRALLSDELTAAQQDGTPDCPV